MSATQPIATDSSSDARAREQAFASVKLTPPLVLTIALMFIIASDDQVEASESSQIQSVLGHNDELLGFASAYVRHVSLQDFLARAAQGLSRTDKICILSNVCDAMLADGIVREMEQKTFDLLRAALGIKSQDFARYRATLQRKNDTSVLGAYRPQAASTSMTPHLALAVSVLYMMSADGSIDKHEIGRLETLVVAFGGLQRIAVGYVKKTNRERFFQEAAHTLNAEQKFLIALNVYDTMTSDGVVAVAEDKIFQAMLDAFGMTSDEFAPHAHVLEAKNLKPFDLRKTKVAQLFDAKLTSEEKTHAAQRTDAPESVGQMVSRTMQDNVQSMEQAIGASGNVVQIQNNALGQLNVQPIEAANDPTHRESVDGGAFTDSRVTLDAEAASVNRQTLDAESAGLNRQTLDAAAAQLNRQTLDADPSALNRQTLDGESYGVNRQSLGAFEVRLDHLAGEIDALYDQLLAFEQQNKKWLSIGQAFREEEEKNRAPLPAATDLASRVQIAPTDESLNLQTLPESTGWLNRQKMFAALPFGATALAPEQTQPQAIEQTEAAGDANRSMQLEVQTPTHTQTQAHVQTQAHEQTRAHTPGQTLSNKPSRFVSSRPGSHGRASITGARLGIKESLIAFAFTLCVSNFGVAKDPGHRAVSGVLVKASHGAHESNVADVGGP